MADLLFKHEMLIPTRNADIYLSIYELENWLRRVCLTACMIIYGKDWPTRIAPEIAKALTRRLSQQPDLFYLGAESDSNLIWATTHGQLKSLLLNQELWPAVEQLTGVTHVTLSTKLDDLRKLRNVLAHNRAFSSHTEVVFRELESEIRPAIENFKTAILYSNHDILSDEDPDPLNVAFQAEMNANDWSKLQAFLARSALFYQFVSLPVDRGIAGTSYISGDKLLERFEDHLDFIITFSANKTGDEFRVLIPRNTPIAQAEELARVFTRNPDVWTSQPFEEQNPQFISHPKIWFYENRRPNPL